VQELARHFYDHWEEGRFHLYRGDLERWFQKDFHRADLEQAAIDIRARPAGHDEDAGLQELLNLCGIAGPSLNVQSTHLRGGTLDLTRIAKVGTTTVTLRLMNSGRGYLYGEVVSLKPWLRISGESQFACPPDKPQASMTLEFSTEAMQEIASPIQVLTVKSNDQQTPSLAIPLKVLFDPRLGITWASGGSSHMPPVDFGEVANGETRQISRSITLANVGGGILEGSALGNEWLYLAPSPFSFGPLGEGQSVSVDMMVDTSKLDIKRSQLAVLPVKTIAGNYSLPAKISVRKRWYTPLVALPLAGFYAVVIMATLAVLAGFIVDPWWYGLGILQARALSEMQFLTRVGLLGMAGACAYLLKPLIDEVEYYYFLDKFRDRLPVWATDRQRVIFVTLILVLMGLAIGAVAHSLKSERLAASIGLVPTAASAAALGTLTTTAGYRWMGRQPLKAFRLILLTLAAMTFCANAIYAIAPSNAYVTAVRSGAFVGAIWALLVAGSESTFLPAIARIKARQIAQTGMAALLAAVGFYGIDLFRNMIGPWSWKIPTQFHLPDYGYDTAQVILSWFIAFVLGVVSSCVAMVGLVSGFAAGAVADSDEHSAELHRLTVKAWLSIPKKDTLLHVLRSAFADRRLHVPDFRALSRLKTAEVREWLQTFTHWPGTSERNWAMTIVLYSVYVLGGYLVFVGGISLLMIPVMVVIGIVALLIYVILVIVAVIIGLAVLWGWLSSQ
jgi:hypothetical protein